MDLVAYRAAAYRTPLWALPNPVAGRYNRSGEAPTTYLALHPLTPWAERLRAETITTPEDAAQLRLPTWAIRITLDDDRVITLDFDIASDHGLKPEDLVSDDYDSCQTLASNLRRRANALIVPSAALPGTHNLVLFGPHVATAYLADPIDDIDVPLSPTATAGRPPEVLADLVHHRHTNEPHPGLDAWRHGETFTLVEPALTSTDLAPANRT